MNPRLFFFTGKGGVGKTSYSLAYTAYLKSIGKNACYISFGENANTALCTKLRVSYQKINVEGSLEKYLTKKLNSKTIASWLIKAPFVFSLFNIIPGLGQMILLGHLIDMLKADETLHLVIDSPASGHALTMFESTHNFLGVFQTGILAEDLKEIHSYLQDPSVTQVFIIGLLTEMALNEAFELKKGLSSLASMEKSEIIINDVYHLSKTLESANEEDLPEILNKKIDIEKNLVSSLDEELHMTQHLLTLDLEQTVRELTPFMEKVYDQYSS